MTRKRITVIIAAIALLIAGTASYATFAVKPAVAPPTQATAPYVPTKYEVGPPDAQELLELVNAERVRAGVGSLAVKETLAQSAQWKADDMASRNYFAHTDPETGKKNGLDYFFSIDDNCRNVSENIRWIPFETATSQTVFNGWYQSASHVTAIRNGNYSLTGLAVAKGDTGYYAVEHFCTTR